MWPHEIVLGPISFNGYGLLLILAVVFSLFFLGWTSPRAGINPKKSFDLAFWLVLFGLLGSRLAYCVFHYRYFKYQPLKIIKYWEGGLMFQGGLLFGLLLTVFLAARGKFNFLIMSDALAPALALGQAIGRLGCLLAGCCHGRPAP
ncbi:MAG: prolipoprotein diacylglyceryl transferase, partial [Deltaproteobacteria bacterium]|nr:prolipoprotein diacylglyceryl transferase [Deltaproteobacteria bacterium]